MIKLRWYKKERPKKARIRKVLENLNKFVGKNGGSIDEQQVRYWIYTYLESIK